MQRRSYRRVVQSNHCNLVLPQAKGKFPHISEDAQRAIRLSNDVAKISRQHQLPLHPQPSQNCMKLRDTYLKWIYLPSCQLRQKNVPAKSRKSRQSHILYTACCKGEAKPLKHRRSKLVVIFNLYFHPRSQKSKHFFCNYQNKIFIKQAYHK